ncbi:MAG: DegV family protein [Peptoniphilus sp.]|nr:DegV family protein [Peptoniphilus sp.]MDY3119136.1 DegV family protein [Peptoniphilus sp.]
MTHYEILIDSSLNVHTSFVDACSYAMIPMTVAIGDRDFSIGRNTPLETVHDFYRRIQTETASTSQIPQSMYEAYFQPALGSGADVLYLSLSSGISATYHQALLAKKDLENAFPGRSVHCVDTRSCGPAGSFLVKRAVENREKGMTAEENKKDLENFRIRVVFTGLITQLDHIKRSGRLSGGMALVGNALHIKPILLMEENGDLVLCDKARGIKQATKRLIQTLEEKMDVEETTIFLSHGDDEDLALSAKEQILEKTDASDVFIDYLTPVVSAHIGQGALGMSFIQKIAD